MSRPISAMFRASQKQTRQAYQSVKKVFKLFALICADAALILLASAVTAAVQTDLSISPGFFYPDCLAYIVCGILPNLIFGCYQYISKYTGIADALRLLAASALNLLLLLILITAGQRLHLILQNTAIDYSSAVICVLIEVYLMGSFRFSKRILMFIGFLFNRQLSSRTKRKVVVYCTLDDCRAVIDFLQPERNKKLTAVISTAPAGTPSIRIGGVRVSAGDLDAFESAIRKYGAQEAIISKGTLNKAELLRAIRICSQSSCLLKIYSGIENCNDSRLREIHIEDLLGRSQTVMNTDTIRQYVRNKTILVTGGAGSIGSEICRQVLDFGCDKLIVLDNHENGLFELDNTLKKLFGTTRHCIAVGSVQDSARLSEIFTAHTIDIVFHTAAYKHVPLMQSNPAEAIKNNVFGTLNIALCAIKHETKKFILISTDKAVNCSSIMGATKRLSEMIIQQLNRCSVLTKFSAVRFGNVLGSNGSVGPVFQRQIKEGGPVTVTHPEVERFFMTILEAVQLVLQAGAMADGGEIFVLDMGKPRKILDLACDMIRMYGLEPGRDIKIKFTGLRPGEKMSEELSYQSEVLIKTTNDKILKCRPANITEDLIEQVKQLQNRLERDTAWDYNSALYKLISQAHSQASG